MKCAIFLILAIFSQVSFGFYPERPIVLVVPFPAGGPVDVMGRILGRLMGSKLGGPVVIENRAGAGGLIGVNAVATSQADGYTLGLAGTGAMIYAPFISKKMPFDPLNSLTLITTLVRTPNVLVVNSNSNFKSINDLVVYAKMHPSQMTFASPGIASSAHVVGELFQRLTGVKFVHVPYKGSGPALQDLMGGHVDLMIGEVSGLVSQIKLGTIRGLALSDSQRINVIKEVPSAPEAGLAAWIADGAYGLVGPQGLPLEIVKRLVDVANEALSSPEVSGKFAELASLPQPGNPDQYKNLIQLEQSRWASVIKSAGITDE